MPPPKGIAQRLAKSETSKIALSSAKPPPSAKPPLSARPFAADMARREDKLKKSTTRIPSPAVQEAMAELTAAEEIEAAKKSTVRVHVEEIAKGDTQRLDNTFATGLAHFGRECADMHAQASGVLSSAQRRKVADAVERVDGVPPRLGGGEPRDAAEVAVGETQADDEEVVGGDVLELAELGPPAGVDEGPVDGGRAPGVAEELPAQRLA